MVKLLISLVCLASACGDDKPKASPCPHHTETPATPAPHVTASPVPTSPSPTPPAPPSVPFPLPFPIPTAIPTAIPTPSQPPAQQGDTSELVKSLLAEINKARVSKGLYKLSIDPGLSFAAQGHSDDLGPKKGCSHTGSSGSTPWTRAESCGTSATGEIIACGWPTPAKAVEEWSLSPGHAAIMFDPDNKYFGAGTNNNFWTAMFRK